jgi:hypothetical protein
LVSGRWLVGRWVGLAFTGRQGRKDERTKGRVGRVVVVVVEGPKRHRVEDELRLEDHEFGRGNDVYICSF